MHEGDQLVRFLLVGFVSGWIASILVRGSMRVRGCFTYVLVGMIGAVVGGYLFRLAHVTGGAGFIGSVLTATVGAMVLLVVLRLVRTPRRARGRTP
jgi:uncharacterized membrane protein YeaQ/YmgE (transglycosylase-associated protein family)